MEAGGGSLKDEIPNCTALFRTDFSSWGYNELICYVEEKTWASPFHILDDLCAQDSEPSSSKCGQRGRLVIISPGLSSVTVSVPVNQWLSEETPANVHVRSQGKTRAVRRVYLFIPNVRQTKRNQSSGRQN